MHRLVHLLLLALLALAPVVSGADDGPAADGTVPMLEPVLVSGTQPGPGMWKVSRGDHVLWVLGTLSPLPARMTWQSDEVDEVLAGAGAVIAAPGLDFDADVGFFGRITLLPSLAGARRSPGGARLDEVLSPELYARWRMLKARWLPRDRKVETFRPIFAAFTLHAAAVKASGLKRGRHIEGQVIAKARRAGARVIEVRETIRIDDPRGAIREFKASELDDQDCFRVTLNQIQTEIGNAVVRANAWAVGDLGTLRQLHGVNAGIECLQVFSGISALRDHEAAQVRARLREKWLDTAVAALERQTSSLALLPIESLLGADSPLDDLAAHGYTVIAPDMPEGSDAEPEPEGMASPAL